MASETEELLWKVSGQLEVIGPQIQQLKDRMEEHGERLTRLEERHRAADEKGREEHDIMRARLKDGDGDLADLRARSAEHSREIRAIQSAMLNSSTKKWDLVQILLGAVVPVVVSGAASLLTWLWMAQKMAAMKGGGAP